MNLLHGHVNIVHSSIDTAMNLVKSVDFPNRFRIQQTSLLELIRFNAAWSVSSLFMLSIDSNLIFAVCAYNPGGTQYNLGTGMCGPYGSNSLNIGMI